jgi:dihydroorotate dehydrogenase (NAD+) catalytic subunit
MAAISLQVQLGRLSLPNPILVASGTFGYAREMEHLVDLDRLGGILPKTVTRLARPGNPPWRTVETAAGLLNSIGLDNDGLDAFIAHHLPYLSGLAAPVIVSIAGRTPDEFVEMARQLDGLTGWRPGAEHLLPERDGRSGLRDGRRVLSEVDRIGPAGMRASAAGQADAECHSDR